MVLATPLTSSAVVGSVEPRVWSRPLRELTPQTSYGFDVIDFARDVLERPLDPWQEWLVIHTEDPAASGKSDVLVIAATAAQMAIGPGSYAFFGWRTAVGSERPIVNGGFIVEEKARL